MNNTQKINKIFRSLPLGGCRNHYLLGRELSKFLIGKKDESSKKKFMRKMFEEISLNMNSFRLLSEIVDYKVCYEDILLSIDSYDGVIDTIKAIKRNFGEQIAKKCAEKLFNELNHEDSLRDDFKTAFPNLC